MRHFSCILCTVGLYVIIVQHKFYVVWYFFFFQAEDGIRDLVRSRGLGDVYKRQDQDRVLERLVVRGHARDLLSREGAAQTGHRAVACLSLIHI